MDGFLNGANRGCLGDREPDLNAMPFERTRSKDLSEADYSKKIEILLSYSNDVLGTTTEGEGLVAEWGDLRSQEIPITQLVNEMKSRDTVQLAYFQGTTAFEKENAFAALETYMAESQSLWGLNLGEVNLPSQFIEPFISAVKSSNITHMYYEGNNITKDTKNDLRDAVRENRSKHSRWKLGFGDDAVVKRCVKMWFNPINHTCNME